MFYDPRQKYETPVIANAFNVWIDIHAPVSLVFKFLTQANGLIKWWATRCESDPRPGGRVRCEWDGERALTGEALFRQFEPPLKLVLEWTSSNGETLHCDGKDSRGMRWPALNVYELMQINPLTTRLHLHDFGIANGPNFEGIRQASEEGWNQALSRLKKAAEFAYQRDLAARKGKARKKASGKSG